MLEERAWLARVRARMAVPLVTTPGFGRFGRTFSDGILVEWLGNPAWTREGSWPLAAAEWSVASPFEEICWENRLLRVPPGGAAASRSEPPATGPGHCYRRIPQNPPAETVGTGAGRPHGFRHAIACAEPSPASSPCALHTFSDYLHPRSVLALQLGVSDSSVVDLRDPDGLTPT
jgi:hypothetical protein